MESESVVRQAHLFILPPAPWPLTNENLAAAYDKPLTATLEKLSASFRHTTVGATLDIAVPLPFIHDNDSLQRSALYVNVQKLVAGIYRRCVVVAAQNSINVEDSEGIDVRVILLSQPRTFEVGQTTASDLPVNGNMMGPVINMHTLARCERNWDSIYSVESEECEAILKQFLIDMDTRAKIQRVEGGIVQVNKEDGAVSENDAEAQPHRSVVVGGTWDHLHIGHKLLLTMVAFLTDTSSTDKLCTITVGITGDELLKEKKNPDLLESWADRCRACSDFLLAIMDFRPSSDAAVKRKEINESGPNGHAIHVSVASNLILNLVEISDPYGPTITEQSISAIVVSAETRSGGKAVNDKRAAKDWPELEVFEVDVLNYDENEKDEKAEDDFKSKISSTGIRQSLLDKAKKRNQS